MVEISPGLHTSAPRGCWMGQWIVSVAHPAIEPCSHIFEGGTRGGFRGCFLVSEVSILIWVIEQVVELFTNHRRAFPVMVEPQIFVVAITVIHQDRSFAIVEISDGFPALNSNAPLGLISAMKVNFGKKFLADFARLPLNYRH